MPGPPVPELCGQNWLSFHIADTSDPSASGTDTQEGPVADGFHIPEHLVSDTRQLQKQRQLLKRLKLLPDAPADPEDEDKNA